MLYMLEAIEGVRYLLRRWIVLYMLEVLESVLCVLELLESVRRMLEWKLCAVCSIP